MNAQEFKKNYLGDDDYDECVGEGCTLVEEGDWQIEHKTQYKTNIYSVGEEYFAVDFSRDNSGYWSDGETYPPEVRKVEPKTETKVIVRWVSVGDVVKE